jgi:hypothetical protein
VIAHQDGRVTLHHCDAIVTDPPRELGFRVIACDRERGYLDDAIRRLRQGVLF